MFVDTIKNIFNHNIIEVISFPLHHEEENDTHTHTHYIYKDTTREKNPRARQRQTLSVHKTKTNTEINHIFILSVHEGPMSVQ